jgi:hypothetical protein
MTATANIVTSEKKQVLLVPNAALRFTPPVTPQQSAAPALPIFGLRPGRGGFNARGRAPEKPGAPNQENLWVLQGEVATPVLVEVGGSDGELTEIVRAVPRGAGGGRHAGAGDRAASVSPASAPAGAGSAAPASAAADASGKRRRREGGAEGPGAAGGEPLPPPKIEEGVPVIVDAEQQGKRPGS